MSRRRAAAGMRWTGRVSRRSALAAMLAGGLGMPAPAATVPVAGAAGPPGDAELARRCGALAAVMDDEDAANAGDWRGAASEAAREDRLADLADRYRDAIGRLAAGAAAQPADVARKAAVVQRMLDRLRGEALRMDAHEQALVASLVHDVLALPGAGVVA